MKEKQIDFLITTQVPLKAIAENIVAHTKFYSKYSL